MITGVDTVLLAAGPAAPAVEDLLRHQTGRWPSMRVAVDDVAGSEFVAWAGEAARLPAERAEILVARDEDMVDSWDRDGYRLTPDGDGPFQIIYERCPLSRLRVLALDDPYGRTGFAFEPYEVLLAGTGLYLVTLVTPDADSEFSRSLIDEMAARLAGPRAPGRDTDRAE